MATAAQEALAEALGTLSVDHNPADWTDGVSTFSAVPTALKPEDPRMLGSSDRIFTLRVETALLTFPYPKRGGEFVSSGLSYPIKRADHNVITGVSTFEIYRASPVPAP